MVIRESQKLQRIPPIRNEMHKSLSSFVANLTLKIQNCSVWSKYLQCQSDLNAARILDSADRYPLVDIQEVLADKLDKISQQNGAHRFEEATDFIGL